MTTTSLKQLFAIPLLAVIASTTAQADAYPSKNIKMVIPYTPGGSIDTVARLVADQLQKQLGAPIVIENIAGASGLVGTQRVKQAKADGYTLLFNASSQVHLPYVMKQSNYDPITDFTAIAQIGHVPLVLAVNNELPVKNFEEFAQLAKAKPGELFWATSGLGTTSHLGEEMINHARGLDMEIIAYRGAASQLSDVVGGHTSAAVSPMPGVIPFLQSQRLRALAVTGKERAPNMPEIPTLDEAGIPGFDLLSWYGLWGPANLPTEIVDKLNTEVAKAINSPELQKRFHDLSFVTTDVTPKEFEQAIMEETEKIKALAKKTKIAID